MNKFSLASHDPKIVSLIAVSDHKIVSRWAIECFNRGRYLFNQNYIQNQVIDSALNILSLWIEDKITM